MITVYFLHCSMRCETYEHNMLCFVFLKTGPRLSVFGMSNQKTSPTLTVKGGVAWRFLRDLPLHGEAC
jgi:hypothetical protein